MLAVAILALASGCAREKPGRIDATIAGVPVSLEVALSGEQRARGYFDRDEPAHGEGILFVFGRDERPGFIMRSGGKTVPFDLGIAFVSAGGEILEVRRLEAGAGETVYPSQPIRYAIEGSWDFFLSAGIKPGTALSPMSVMRGLDGEALKDAPLDVDR